MKNQRLIVFRDLLSGEDLAIFIVSEIIKYVPGQCISIASSSSEEKLVVTYIIDRVFDSIVLVRDPVIDDGHE